LVFFSGGPDFLASVFAPFFSPFSPPSLDFPSLGFFPASFGSPPEGGAGAGAAGAASSALSDLGGVRSLLVR
jgi:hypothetical protein